MNRRTFSAGLVGVLAGGCGRPSKAAPAAAATPKQKSMKNEMVFLTRVGCVNTPDMLNKVDDALRALELALDYPVIDLARLPANDPRLGYPTPTILVHNHDIYGMPEPTPPFLEPS
jgi:hypothetical protein